MSVLNREFNSVVAENGRSPLVPVVHVGQPRRFADATPGDGVEPVRPLRQRDVLGPGVDPGISHGELIRAGDDQTVPLNPCQSQFLYQGMDPNADGDHISPPWRMGLLTQTNSTC